MTNSPTIDQSVNKATFWSAIVLVLAGVLSVFFPLDAPAGTMAERMMWFSKNLNSFVIAWAIQMIAMLTLSAVCAGIAWQVRESAPVRVFLAFAALMAATMAFLIPKFIALWSIPQMIAESTTVSANAALAEQLFQLLNPTIAYTLFTSLDYLGFWMYSVMGLLIAAPLFRLGMSAKIAAAGFGLYGVLYHLLLFGVMFSSVPSADIVIYSGSAAALLLVPVISM